MQIDATLHTWHIILNANALMHQSKRFWQDVKNKLNEAQIHYLHHVTTTIDNAKELIINLCNQGDRHFILIGGDGTLNTFVNAVMESQVNSSDLFVALIPLGTGNDWSRSHGYSNRYSDAIDALMKGNFLSHDVGLVETVVNDKVIDIRYFVNIAGFGFDGLVIYNTTKKRSKIFTEQMYLINLLKSLLSYQAQPVTLRSHDFNITKNIFTIAAGICQYNGNGMHQCPDAIPNDGLFDVVMIEKVSVLKVLRNIKNLFKGTHIKNLKEVSVCRTNYLEIISKPFILGEVEGEMLMTGNYRIRCLASAINFLQAK